MPLKEILEDRLFKLPLTYKGEYKDFITNILRKQFLSKVRALKNNNNALNLSLIESIEYIIDVQEKLINGLIESITEYYDGYPNAAFNAFNNAIVNATKDISSILKIIDVGINQNFYRMRLVKDNIPLSKDEMFHVPFDLRGMVSTQRFSIPGFPSLYMGNSVYVCWEELGRPNLNDFQVVRLQTKNKLKVIDLAPINVFEEDEYSLYKYFMTWPLVAACSIKVANRNNTFKPEYIIPQLLLQWVRTQQSVDGIRYQTTHIDFRNSLTRGDLWNLVIPVKENKGKGLCKKLKTMFHMTEPISWQLDQIANGATPSITYFSSEFVDMNKNISKLEIIKGRESIYGYSVLGKLERSLDNEPASKI